MSKKIKEKDMEFKQSVEKKYHYEDRLGSITVDIPVNRDVNGEIYLSLTTVQTCARKVAYNFYIQKIKEEGVELTSEEVIGIMNLIRLTKSQFAKCLGLSKSAISHIISGNRATKNISRTMLLTLAQELMLPNYWLSMFNTDVKKTIDQEYISKLVSNKAA